MLLSRHQTLFALLAIVLVLASLSELGLGSEFSVTITEMFIRMIIVVALSVFIGNSGVVSFGHISFVCIGAYAAAWFTASTAAKGFMLPGLPDFLLNHQYPFGVAMLAAAALPALVGLLLGASIMRMPAMSASIATFAFLLVVNNVYSNWDSVTAGTNTLMGLPTVVGPWTGAAFAAIAIVLAYFFKISRYGLMLQASMNDEVAARASSIAVVRLRVAAFTLSAAIAGLAGGLYAQFLGVVTIEQFFLDLTVVTIAMLVVGGISSLTGAIYGVVVVTLIIELMRMAERSDTAFAPPPGAQGIGLGIFLAIILIMRPKGLSNGKELNWGFGSRS